MFVRRLNNHGRPSALAAGWDDLRAHNTALLLRAIWSEEGLSRADLARRSGLSRATVSDIVGGFVDLGVVIEAGADSTPEVAPSSGGRPPIRLEFHDGWRHLIGVELGAEHVSGVRTDLRGRVLGRFVVERDVEGDPAGTLAAMDAGIRTLRAIAPETAVIGIGLGVASPLRFGDHGRLATHLFPRWSGIDLNAHLAGAHALPVRLDNDANLGALAEHWWGAGRDVSDLAFIKLATGVGAGILIGGDIHRGATGIAGEIGHTTIDTAGPRCRCGRNGCLEAFVGSAQLLERAHERLAADPDGDEERPAWALPRATVHTLVAGARAGDPVARELVTTAGTWLGVAIANLLNLVNPGRVVLGGPLTEAGPLLVGPLTRALEQRALFTSVAGSSVVVSALGDDAVAIGAATLVLQGALSDPTLFLGSERAERPPFRVSAPLLPA
ncbi:MAG: ROK family transcriptional regulator [Myxococcota bacterium]